MFYTYKVTVVRIIFFMIMEEKAMKHITTLTTRNLKASMKKGGCGECQTSCQSACKTSCTVGNQTCESVKKETK